MAITDELREYAHDCCARVDDAIHAIADRIDEQNAEAQRRWMAELDAARDRDGYIELPKDADGVPWHIGDRTESGQTVGAMGLNKHGWCFIGTVNEIDPSLHRHHKQPTVEDVLREFALACEDAGNAGPEVGRLAAEYASRLRLAGEGE